jgi:hypothetical protein
MMRDEVPGPRAAEVGKRKDEGGRVKDEWIGGFLVGS